MTHKSVTMLLPTPVTTPHYLLDSMHSLSPHSAFEIRSGENRLPAQGRDGSRGMANFATAAHGSEYREVQSPSVGMGESLAYTFKVLYFCKHICLNGIVCCDAI